ncbi:MAG: DUF2330 domain-containing protein [Candidatus Brocadiae bacterium]|nr:DUF2330 domain-containing protein [Candidatus Brocadiia bacterium]
MGIVTGWGRWTAATAAAMAIGTAGIGTLSLVPAPADAACCYFAAQEKDINQPGQKAFITWDPAAKIESWTVQPKFEGNAVDFGMVIPSPSQPKLDEMPRDFFKNLAIYTILMPLPQPIYAADMLRPRRGGVAFGAGGMADKKSKNGDKGVTVLEAGVVGSLDYKIITAEKADGLFDWLKENEYVYSGDQGTLDFYIRKKWFFTVMKIDPRQMKRTESGSYTGEVTPTRFTFSTDTCVYPLRITALSVKDKTDALFYVQAPQQMDLEGDLSWMHSYRVMFLTYMLGCAANEDQQKELALRQQWVQAKLKMDPAYETTKLEWAKKLGAAELSVCEEPLKNYAQMGLGTLPAGYTLVSLEELVTASKEAWLKMGNKDDDAWRARARELETLYTPDKGVIVRVADAERSFNGTTFEWWPHRAAPDEDVKQLALLKGHLQSGQWVTKFRKILRRDEMTDDLTLVPVEAAKEQEYVRIMPTSPP